MEDRKALLGHTVGDVTTHYSAPDLRRLLEFANRLSETRATVLRVVDVENGAKVGHRERGKARRSSPGAISVR